MQSSVIIQYSRVSPVIWGDDIFTIWERDEGISCDVHPVILPHPCHDLSQSPSLPVSHYTTPTTSPHHWHGDRDRGTEGHLPSPAPCAVCLPAVACWGSCWLTGGSRRTCHWSAAGTASSWGSAWWCASWQQRVLAPPQSSHSQTEIWDLNFFTTHELCRARKNIAAPRIRRIFIWKSWKIIIP